MALKYGGGPAVYREGLAELSDLALRVDTVHTDVVDLRLEVDGITAEITRAREAQSPDAEIQTWSDSLEASRARSERAGLELSTIGDALLRVIDRLQPPALRL